MPRAKLTALFTMGYWPEHPADTISCHMIHLLVFTHLLQTNHTNRYAAATATKVKGNPIFAKSLNITSQPSFLSRPQATILAEAPMGVIFPPRLVPISKPKRNSDGLRLSLSDIETATGSIAARKGTLSIKADRITETKTMMV